MNKSFFLFTLILAPCAFAQQTIALSTSNNPVAGYNKAAISDAIQYVSTNGSDANDGLSLGTAKLTVAAAYSVLPTCTVAKVGGSSSFDHCGAIVLGAGTFPSSAQLVIDSPHVLIAGSLPGPTILKYTGATGCYVAWHDANFGGPTLVDFSGGLYNVTIDGSGAAAGTCGLETYDIIGFRMHGVAFNNFSGAGSSGWWDNAVSQFQERDRAEWECSNAAICWNVTAQSTALGYPNTTFGYGEFNFWAQVFSGQTAASFNAANFSESTLHAVINGNNAGTAFSVTNHSQISDDLVAIHYETLTPNSGFVVDGTSKVQLMGSLDTTGFGNTISPGGVFSFFHTGSSQGAFSVNAYLDSQNPATSNANQNSPYFQINGNYWKGNTTATDIWQLQDVLGKGSNPSSTLYLAHEGSPGTATVGVTSRLYLMSRSGGPGVTLVNPPGIADFPVITLPDATGNVALALTTSFTTKAATTDNVTVKGMTPSGHCQLTPTNSGAAGGIASVYVSEKKTDQITVTHTATSGWTFDVWCTPN